MATIRKRGEYQWQAIIKKKGFPLQSRTFPYKKEAEEWAGTVEHEMRRGAFMPRQEVESTLVQDLIKTYREDVLPAKRAKWIPSALTALEADLGKYSLAALTSKLVTEHRNSWLTSGLSASTVKQRINLLSKLIDLAGKEWGIPLPANPCAMVSRPPENRARERRLGADEEVYLLAACTDRMSLLVRFALETAGRLGELLSLRWPDVDLQKRVAIIRGIDGRGTKNGDPLRGVPLSQEALVTLKAVKKLPRNINGRVFHWWAASDSFNKSWVRAVARGRKSYLEDCKKARKRPDPSFLVDLRFHDLRHEATSRLFERGVFDSMEVASVTGHKTLQMLKRYTHLRAEDLAKKL